MALSRREALTAAVACGLATTEATAAPVPPTIKPPSDPLYSRLPKEARAVVEDTFPLHLCIRLVERRVRDETVAYRVTVFNPASRGAQTRMVDGESVSEPILYHLELTPRGTVIEETPRPILDLARLPKPVVESYRKWNPREVRGMYVQWITQVPRGGTRTYRAHILMSAIKAYDATFQPDGTVVSANPPEVR
jgi:hypothetical protein